MPFKNKNDKKKLKLFLTKFRSGCQYLYFINKSKSSFEQMPHEKKTQIDIYGTSNDTQLAN